MFNRNKVKIKFTLDYVDAVQLRNILSRVKCDREDAHCAICSVYEGCKCFWKLYQLLDLSIYECKKGRHS